MTPDLPNHQVVMVRPHLRDLPPVQLPPGFSIRPYQSGDEANWLAVQQAAEPFLEMTLKFWQSDFGADPAELHRQLFLCDGDDVIGTTSAWYGDEAHGRHVARIHWVAITPPYQGRGLSKPLLSAALHLAVELGHQTAYLVTSTGRVAAIHLYCRFGFIPEILTDKDRDVWRVLRGATPAIDNALNAIG